MLQLKGRVAYRRYRGYGIEPISPGGKATVGLGFQKGCRGADIRLLGCALYHSYRAP